MSGDLIQKRERLLQLLKRWGRVVVAFSGGVDSSVVAKAAQLALGDGAVAVTADSPSVARSELTDARELAAQIGIRHLVVQTEEFEDKRYIVNDGTRCYYCKTELYGKIKAKLPELGEAVICSGANTDDWGDYRPGLKAAAEQGVKHPLQEVGMSKAEVRLLAREWQLRVWDKPAAPCLSSRLAPGLEVTRERTGRVEEAEAYLKGLGLAECRVRLHPGELARIEVPAALVPRLAQPETAAALAREFKRLGFQFVTLDLEGLRSGSLNVLVDLHTRRSFERAAEGSAK